MNILITGSKGFIGKELSRYFGKEHNVIATDRSSIDPTKYESVKHFFDNNDIDVVIHAAIKGGKRGHQENIEDLYENLFMFDNLSSFSNHFKVMFNFGSGAEFDRRVDIRLLKEKQIESRLPSDYYGLAKNLITRKINHLDSNIYNLRLFGCFGEHEEPQRLFRNTFNKFKNNESAIIHQDKYMDYFYAQDIGRVIEHITLNRLEKIPKDINLCYGEKYKLSDYINKIKNLMNIDLDVIIQNSIYGCCYSGSDQRLRELDIQLLGLDKGMEQCLKKWHINK